MWWSGSVCCFTMHGPPGHHDLATLIGTWLYLIIDGIVFNDKQADCVKIMWWSGYVCCFTTVPPGYLYLDLATLIGTLPYFIIDGIGFSDKKADILFTAYLRTFWMPSGFLQLWTLHMHQMRSNLTHTLVRPILRVSQNPRYKLVQKTSWWQMYKQSLKQ